MNILQVVPELSAGGVERTVLEVTQALVENGHAAHVASLGGRLESELIQLGGKLHKLDMKSKNPFTWMRNISPLKKIITEHEIDIVHIRSRAPARSALKAARACDVPVLTTYHGIYNAKSALKRRYNNVMVRGDHIIANSSFTRDHIVAEHGISPNTITVVPRGVDMARFHPDLVTPANIAGQRADWGIDANTPIILLPGRLTSWKGQKVAIKALAKLDSKPALVLLGDAQGRETYVNSLWALAKDLGVTDQLRIPGHSESVPVALATSELVLSASTDPEAFGRVAAEAQAMSRWVIASDHGGARETVIEGVTGNLVAPGDCAALARAISTALTNPPSTSQSRAHIAANFSDAQLKRTVLQIYAQILARKAG